MPVLTGATAHLPKEFVEDYGLIVKEGYVTIVGVIAPVAMSKPQLLESVGAWIARYPSEDPMFFTESIYVIVYNEDTSLTYIPVEIFKKYATELPYIPTGFMYK